MSTLLFPFSPLPPSPSCFSLLFCLLPRLTKRRRFRGTCLGPCRRRQLAMKSSSAAASPAARPCKRAASTPPPRIAGRGCPTCRTGCIMRRQAQVWCPLPANRLLVSTPSPLHNPATFSRLHSAAKVFILPVLLQSRFTRYLRISNLYLLYGP